MNPKETDIPQEYIAQKGDTLQSIAVRFDLSLSWLRQINNLFSDFILPGDVIKVWKRKEEEGYQLKIPAQLFDPGDQNHCPYGNLYLYLDKVVFNAELSQETLSIFLESIDDIDLIIHPFNEYDTTKHSNSDELLYLLMINYRENIGDRQSNIVKKKPGQSTLFSSMKKYAEPFKHQLAKAINNIRKNHGENVLLSEESDTWVPEMYVDSSSCISKEFDEEEENHEKGKNKNKNNLQRAETDSAFSLAASKSSQLSASQELIKPLNSKKSKLTSGLTSDHSDLNTPNSTTMNSSGTQEMTSGNNSKKLPRKVSHQNPMPNIEILNGTSEILLPEDFTSLRTSLPYRYKNGNWRLLFQLSRDGCSYSSFFKRTENLYPIVLVLKTDNNERIGAFASRGFQFSQQYYGSGETFVFKLTPKYEFYTWSQANKYFIASSEEEISIGGGGSSAIWIDGNLLSAFSESCSTFNSPGLTSNYNFKINDLEAWKIDSGSSRK
ncbi:hypothetical protein TRFO_22596 [Tritrichomonas foetus]|uniref:Oxidation resistance protein 1 n=1 Tax=Tritrichomonas foetus TaxID=1144522 RepID=A0A1J4KCY4_9EUKA|nr:hypothetical protein TRFO_22596 [Tritrichomonas foetus]|eukprot:OHT08834.1 hypothetical protein TRFO_22596 [Tritrichomonas foetus]